MSTNRQFKILILSLSGIGNFMMHTPMITAIKMRYPKSKITVWVAPRGTKQLAMTIKEIDNVIESPIKASLSTHWMFSRKLKRESYDLGIVAFPGQHWKSAGHMYLAGIKRRIGHRYLFLASSDNSFLLTDDVVVDNNIHDIEQNLALLLPLGVRLPESESQYALNISDTTMVKADELIGKLNIDSGKKIIGMHLGSLPSFIWKRWPLENFVTVAKKMIGSHNAHILIFGGPDEHGLKIMAANQIGDGASLIDSDLLTGIGVIKHCRLFLSNDSGLMHLAAAVGVKTLGLFGPTDEKRIGPRGKVSYAVRASGTKAIYNTDTNFNLGDKPHQSMRAIMPGTVIDRIVAIM
jgi:heptosyltransferase II